ncbi:ATP-binding protein [Paenibacillus senegalensis]|uniref:ATP-binding protein n=1 Tax=Paenibacillus senegalensis TaxID=1465766 RepID=UPI000288668E|nr:ATP-binding protein [Paenibacillus senegalensis]
MGFRKKQYLGFGLVLFLMLAMVIVVMGMLTMIRSNVTEIVDDRYQKVKMVTDFRNEFTRMDYELAAVAAQGSISSQNAELINQLRNASLAHLSSLESVINSEQGRLTYSTLQADLNHYLATMDQLVNDLQSGTPAAVEQLHAQSQLLRQDVILGMEQFKAMQEDLMQQALDRSIEVFNWIITVVVGTSLICLLAGLWISSWVIQSTSRSIQKITSVMGSIDVQKQEEFPRIPVETEDEIGSISAAYNSMAESLEKHSEREKEYIEKIERQNWVKTRVAETATMYQGMSDLQTLGRTFISTISEMLGAHYAVFYLMENNQGESRLTKLASFAATHEKVGKESIALGEGLVGQCALEKRQFVLNDVPRNYVEIQSGLGQAAPACIVIVPVIYEGAVEAVIELAGLAPFTELQMNLLHEVLAPLGITIDNLHGRMEVERLLRESQVMTEELQTQAEELQSQSEELQMQTEEMKITNEQLEEQNQLAEQKTMELEKMKAELEKHAQQLQQSSRYKSEFLANMSHELRTPLNSMLILSQMLFENRKGHLSAEEQEYARVIHSAGNDLLNLINDILDLSKIESGKVELFVSEVSLQALLESVDRTFSQLALNKQIRFNVQYDPNLQPMIATDEQRLTQIINNLLSNAFKFTESGSVTLSARTVGTKNIGGKVQEGVVAFSVTDTGIGIPADKQQLIFEAFQQADGATSRKYGGTGLGLSICRQFAELMGGTIELQSEEGKGSTFTLYIPCLLDKQAGEREVMHGKLEASAASGQLDSIGHEPEAPVSSGYAPHPYRNDSTGAVWDRPGDEQRRNRELEVDAQFAGKKVLIVDDDIRNVFALTTALENQQMEVAVANNGREALQALEDNPDFDLVLMDIMMPEMDGFETMRILRSKKRFAELPVIALTAKAMKSDREKCLEAGASDYISKPLHMDQLFSLMRVWLAK